MALAQAFLDQCHKGSGKQALRTADKRSCWPEPLPLPLIRAQVGPVAWVAATSTDQGVVLTDSGGALRLVPWDDLRWGP